jgi:hypothetical protein
MENGQNLIQPAYYEIKVKGQLTEQWSDWFDGLTVTSEANGETVLSGWVRDQAALHGVLMKVRDLGITLLAVTRIESKPGEE